jgi:hypothetical protein
MCAVNWSRGEQSLRRDPLILLWTWSVDRPYGDDEGKNVHQCLWKIKLKILIRESPRLFYINNERRVLLSLSVLSSTQKYCVNFFPFMALGLFGTRSGYFSLQLTGSGHSTFCWPVVPLASHCPSRHVLYPFVSIFTAICSNHLLLH